MVTHAFEVASFIGTRYKHTYTYVRRRLFLQLILMTQHIIASCGRDIRTLRNNYYVHVYF